MAVETPPHPTKSPNRPRLLKESASLLLRKQFGGVTTRARKRQKFLKLESGRR
jgi:hypothetical protein